MSEFDFHNGMLDCLQASLTAAVAEVNRLRAANKTLRADLNAVPVEMWELQEKVTSLELQLASALANAREPQHCSLPKEK